METEETQQSDFQPRQPYSAELAAAFLAAFRTYGDVLHTAEVLELNRTSLYRWRKEHPDFDEAWNEADLYVNESILNELTRRGRDGYKEPVYYLGKVVGHIQKFSDKCLTFMAGARMPELRPNRQSLEVSNKAGETFQTDNLNLNDLTHDELCDLQKFKDGVRARLASDTGQADRAGESPA